MEFRLKSNYAPMGDQPEAIAALAEGIRNGVPCQTLQGVTGSGKTFTVANVIAEVGRPTLVLSHNKTLAAQLYQEFRQFFPDNAVEYFVSYYDYYQPEAYIISSDTYIEKDLMINQEIEKMRLSASSALLSGRTDVIIVSSVSCIYGIGNPADFHSNVIELWQGMTIDPHALLHRLVDSLYSRNEIELNRGNFRIKGDTLDVFPAYTDFAVRVLFWGNEIEALQTFDPLTGQVLERPDRFNIYPANLFVTTKERISRALTEISLDLGQQVNFFEQEGKPIEAERLSQRVNYDLEMIREIGHCSGMENYSRYFDGRPQGSRPFCLLDYFPDDFLLVIDESHVTVSQVRAMYGGDRARKVNLVEYGFRLPAAMDNRPLKFDEFESLTPMTLYVSATPGDYELVRSEGVVVEQLIRPTGLLDPVIEICPTAHQIDDLMERIEQVTARDERTLVTTLTKRMAEELSDYFDKMGIRCRYIHSDVDTLERVQIMDELRQGLYDVLVGVNLLREGLDLPEVSLVAVLDADKEGFLRSHRSLTQTAGRAARNINGRVIFYADTITRSMRQTMDETDRRRTIQLAYNEKHGIVPRQIVKALAPTLGGSYREVEAPLATVAQPQSTYVVDPIVKHMGVAELQKTIDYTRKLMLKAAEETDFLEAAQHRDELLRLEKLLTDKGL